MSEPVSVLDEVTVEYEVPGCPAVVALDRVSLTVRRGESMAVLGRSGSGKSTLIAVLSLLRQPTTGTLAIGGRPTARLGDRELARLRSRFVGTVFQSFHLDPGFTASENVMLPWVFGGSRRRATPRAHAADLLALVGIGELATRKTGQMSGGQRQRVAIARALFNDPLLLVADEPTGNLDEATAESVAQLLFGLPRETGTAVVVVTHDEQISARADSVLRISQGRAALEPRP